MCENSKPPPPEPRVSATAAEVWKNDVIKPQLGWYDAKARTAKTWHVTLSSVQLVSTASIPVINTIVHSVAVSSVLAGIAAVATGLAQLMRHHENWLNYRAAANALENLQKRYEAGLPPFHDANRHDLFVAEADRIMGDESGKWLDGAKSKVPKLTVAQNEKIDV